MSHDFWQAFFAIMMILMVLIFGCFAFASVFKIMATSGKERAFYLISAVVFVLALAASAASAYMIILDKPFLI